jgi:hypothetical protein
MSVPQPRGMIIWVNSYQKLTSQLLRLFFQQASSSSSAVGATRTAIITDTSCISWKHDTANGE